MTERNRHRLAAALIFATLSGAACAPVVAQRGYLPEQNKLDSIAIGLDTKETIVERLGTPSALASFDSQTWYYIAAIESQVAFQRPTTKSRSVVAVSFDPAGIVQEVKRYTEEDGRQIALNDRKTPTRGRELSFWEQMFGNIGRLPTGGEGEGPGGGPGGQRN